MVTTTYYFPRNSTGRYVLDSIARNVGCSIGNIRKVSDTIAVPKLRQSTKFQRLNLYFKCII